MKAIKIAIITLMVAFGFCAVLAPATATYAADPLSEICPDPENPLCPDPSEPTLMDYVGRIIKTMMFVLGSISVIMIIYAGIRYTTSAGDAKAVETAKSTLTYSVVGIVVAVLAYAIVSFVTGRLGL